MPLQDYIGSELPPATVVLERGPVANFAKAIKDDSPVYQSPDAARAAGLDGIPLPPTYPFAMTHWGTFPELQPEQQSGPHPVTAVLGEVMQEGGLILHGEHEFIYHAPVVVGETLTSTGRIADVYTKDGSGGSRMTFVTWETDYRNAAGELAITSVMTLIHRSKAPTAQA